MLTHPLVSDIEVALHLSMLESCQSRKETKQCESGLEHLLVWCCRSELKEALQLVKPQHFLPVHGEYAFLCAHAQLAQEQGVRNTSVIRNGQVGRRCGNPMHQCCVK